MCLSGQTVRLLPSGNCRSSYRETAKCLLLILLELKPPGTYCASMILFLKYFIQFFLHKPIIHLYRDKADYAKMNKKTCISTLRYLDMHTVALLCAMLYMVKYIYKIKKELCKSEQWKYLNSKLVLTLYKFDVNSLHSVRILQCFPSCVHDFL